MYVYIYTCEWIDIYVYTHTYLHVWMHCMLDTIIFEFHALKMSYLFLCHRHSRSSKSLVYLGRTTARAKETRWWNISRTKLCFKRKKTRLSVRYVLMYTCPRHPSTSWQGVLGRFWGVNYLLRRWQWMSREGESVSSFHLSNLDHHQKRFQKWRLPIAFLNSGRKHTNPEPHETEDSLSGGEFESHSYGTLVPVPCCFSRRGAEVDHEQKNACR